MRVTLAELACLLAGELEGDGQTTICGIAPLDQAQTGDITFLTESKHMARLATSRATAVLVAPHIPVDRPAIRVADVVLPLNLTGNDVRAEDDVRPRYESQRLLEIGVQLSTAVLQHSANGNIARGGSAWRVPVMIRVTDLRVFRVRVADSARRECQRERAKQIDGTAVRRNDEVDSLCDDERAED